jgi:hypothetical protein
MFYATLWLKTFLERFRSLLDTTNLVTLRVIPVIRLYEQRMREMYVEFKVDFAAGSTLGCQIFLGKNIPKWEKDTKLTQTVPNSYSIAVKYSKWSLNIPTFFIPRQPKI